MKKSILIVSTECAPYQKLGGLGDANADFSKAYKKFFPDNEITVILPLYGVDKPQKEHYVNGFKLINTNIEFEYQVGIYKANAVIYEVLNPLNNVGVKYIYSDIYSDTNDIYQGDVFLNSAAFSNAVLTYLDKYAPHLPDIIHTTDFPVFLKDYKSDKLKNIKIVHVVHNAGMFYQSITDLFRAACAVSGRKEFIKVIKNKDFKKLCHMLYKKYKKSPFGFIKNTMEECKYINQNYNLIKANKDNHEILKYLNLSFGNLFKECEKENPLAFNPVKKCLMEADFWLTDSMTYYEELYKDEFFSDGLYNVILNTKDKSAPVLAGIDPERYNPINSKNIQFLLKGDDIEAFKEENKKYLLDNFSKEKIEANKVDLALFSSKRTGILGYLDKIDDAVLIFMSSRLDVYQKG
ncbi:glycogen/starch synthase, partial [bacterium]|nr:glycogen/starch synthase [bacterium]